MYFNMKIDFVERIGGILIDFEMTEGSDQLRQVKSKMKARLTFKTISYLKSKKCILKEKVMSSTICLQTM